MAILTERITESVLSSVRRMGVRQARNDFADLIGQVHDGGEPVVVERAGKPMVVIVPMEMYAAYLSERAARFQALDDLLASVPTIDEDEAEADIAEAIASVRAAKRELPL